MDSPLTQTSANTFERMRSNSTLSFGSLNSRGAIQKRSPSLPRSIASSQADRLFQLALDQSSQPDPTSFRSAPHWLTPQSSPELREVPSCPSNTLPWTVPTPPYSESGISAACVEANNVDASLEMSSLGFLLPSQYGTTSLEAEPSSELRQRRHRVTTYPDLAYAMDQTQLPTSTTQPLASTAAATAYAPMISASPDIRYSRSMPTYDQHFRSFGSHQQNEQYHRPDTSYDSVSSGGYSLAPSQSMLPISAMSHSPHTTPVAGSTSSGIMSPFPPPLSRSTSSYDPSLYAQIYSVSSANASSFVSAPGEGYPTPYGDSSGPESVSGASDRDASIRVVSQRPKPQCWEHGCGGRQFSTFSNLLRHQREKSGTASKSYCPKCGAEFTRTTARNGHMANEKCTKRRSSEGK